MVRYIISYLLQRNTISGFATSSNLHHYQTCTIFGFEAKYEFFHLFKILLVIILPISNVLKYCLS